MNRLELLTEAANLLLTYVYDLKRSEKEDMLSKGLAYSLVTQAEELALHLDALIKLELEYVYDN